MREEVNSNMLDNLPKMPDLNARLYEIVGDFTEKTKISQFIQLVNDRVPEEMHLYQQKFGRYFSVDKRNGGYAAVQIDDLVSVYRALPEINMRWLLLGFGNKYIEVKDDGLDNGANSGSQDQDPL